MTNIQTLIQDMCQWNRIVAGDRDALNLAREAFESEERIATLDAVHEFSYAALKEIEIEAVKKGLLELTQSYCYISPSEVEDAQ